jgi:hypothetical protein
MKATLSWLALVLFAGAAHAAEPVRMEIEITPEAGIERLANKGEAVTATSAVEAVDAITTTQAYSSNGLTVPAGRLSMWRTYPGGRLYQFFGSLHRDVPATETQLVTGGIFVPDDKARPAQLYWNDYVRGPVFHDAPGIVFAETPYRRNTLIALKSDLVFTGTEAGKAVFLYREFEGDMVRPLKTEPGSFDLASSPEFVFHGARIRLLGQAGEALRYVMLEPLNPPEPQPNLAPPVPDELAPGDEDTQEGRRPQAPPPGDLL